MKRIGIVSRVLLFACSAALVIVLFVPIWKIDLVAPQYPEGLYLLIHANKLAGNVDIINGLNHYIGMKTLHTEDFFEFTILPYLVAFFALLFLAAAIIGKRKFLYVVFAAFLLFGIVAMVDFWKWEYNYGHNLDPDAAIKVPGMTYQPPLIGYKQLLNFSAYSMPDIGGWIFLGVGVVALGCVIMDWRSHRKWKKKSPALTVTTLVVAVCLLGSCSTSPEQIKIGTDPCAFCKMTISDARYAAEVVTKKGKAYKFDDTHCLFAFIKSDVAPNEIRDIYVSDFAGTHALINVKNAVFFRSDELRTPMGGDLAAFANRDSLKLLSSQLKGSEVSWVELFPK